MPETAFIDLPRGWAKSDGDLSYNDPIKALEMIRPDATAFVPLLGKAMKSPHYWVREAAIEAILAVATWSSPSRAELAGALLEVADRRPAGARHQGGGSLEPFHGPQPGRGSPGETGPSGARECRRATGRRPLRPGLAAIVRGGAAAAPPRGSAGDRWDDLAGLHPRRRRSPTADRDDVSGAVRGAGRGSGGIAGHHRAGADRKIDLRGQLHWRESLGQREGDPGFQQFVREIQRRQTSLIEPGVRALKAIGDRSSVGPSAS